MPNSTIIKPGVRRTAYTATFPARKYWYRHDQVVVNGQLLIGHIQVRHRAGRTDVITCFENSCVQGANTDWLIAQQPKEVTQS